MAIIKIPNPPNSGNHILNTIRGVYFKDDFANDIVVILIVYANVLLRCRNFVFGGVKTFFMAFHAFPCFHLFLTGWQEERKTRKGFQRQEKSCCPPKEVER